jgi:hypothetical protein
MTLVLNMHAPTFSASSYIGANINVIPNHTYRMNNSSAIPLPDSYTIVLQGAYCGATPKDYYAPVPLCELDLPMDQAAGEYRKHILDIVYRHEGEFDVLLYSKSSPDMPPTSVGKGFVKISDAEATMNFRIFQVSSAIAGLAIILAALSLINRSHPVSGQEEARKKETT